MSKCGLNLYLPEGNALRVDCHQTRDQLERKWKPRAKKATQSRDMPFKNSRIPTIQMMALMSNRPRARAICRQGHCHRARRGRFTTDVFNFLSFRRELRSRLCL